MLLDTKFDRFSSFPARCQLFAMNLKKVHSDLNALERDASLTEETKLGARARALDFIAFVDEIVRMRGSIEDLTVLKQQATSLKHRLESINEQLFQRLRADIQSGSFTPQELRYQFDQYTTYSAKEKGQVHMGYDGLDVLVNGLMNVGLRPQEPNERDPEMVHYEATPARAILDLIDNVGLTQDDIFYDLGSGLGQVAILVHLSAESRRGESRLSQRTVSMPENVPES